MLFRCNIFQWKPLNVAMAVTVGEDVHPLLPHLLDQVLQLHRVVDDALHGRLVPAAELDEGDQAWFDCKLCLQKSRRTNKNTNTITKKI